ncbi:MAG: hypothetical protein M1831_001331 [Alyxoria varia]|nr:MAG: hypothetical protein M1831_001331 [Alyxoria varia]
MDISIVSGDLAVLTRSNRRASVHMPVKAQTSGSNDVEDIHASLGDLNAVNDLTGSFSDLQYEASIDSSPIAGRKRLVDCENCMHKKAVWLQLLQFRQRLDGPNGVIAIWEGMRLRDVDLPTSGEYSEFMWKTFTSVGFQDSSFLEQIIDYARSLYERRKMAWPNLLPVVVKDSLRNRPSKAYDLYFRLRRIQPARSSNLEKLFPEALTSKSSIKYFKGIYCKTYDQNIYRTMVPALCKKNKIPEALAWHRLMLSRGDGPQTPSDTLPLRQSLEKLGKSHQLREMKELKIADETSQSDTRNGPQRNLVAESVSEPGEKNTVHARGSVIDYLAARWFATTHFTLDAVIAGLSMSRIRALGSQSMRELGARCSSAQEFPRRLEQLKLNGMRVGDTVFIQLLKHLATDQKDELFYAVIRNDAHADVYEDKNLQSQLLGWDISRKDWRMAQVRLITLTMFHDGSTRDAWNRVLLGLVKQRKWHMVHQVLDNMLLKGISVSSNTVSWCFYSILRPRKPGNRPTTFIEHPHFDDLRYLTNVWLKIFDYGGHVPAKAWNQVHNVYGMTGRLEEMETLSLWLAVLYSRDPTSMAFKRANLKRLCLSVGSQSRARRRKPCPPGLMHIFRRQRQVAIIEWAFKTMGSPIPNANKPHAFAESTDYLAAASRIPHRSEHWTRGVALLRTLKRYGVPVHPDTVRKACRLRLRILFGPGQSSDLSNRVAVRQNRYTLGHMVRVLNRVWGQNIFNVPSSLLRDESALKQHVLGESFLAQYEHRSSASRLKAFRKWFDQSPR